MVRNPHFAVSTQWLAALLVLCLAPGVRGQHGPIEQGPPPCEACQPGCPPHLAGELACSPEGCCTPGCPDEECCTEGCCVPGCESGGHGRKRRWWDKPIIPYKTFCDRPTWEVHAHYLFADRDEPDDAAIFVDATGMTQFLNADDFSLDVEHSVVGSITYWHDCFWGVEVRVEYFAPWEADEDVNLAANSTIFLATQNLTGPINIGAAGGVLASDYKTEFMTGEVNMVHRPTPWLKLIAGLRWASFDEELQSLVTGVMSLESEAQNQMYGFQLGLDASLIRWVGLNHIPWRFDVFMRAGGFYNDAEAETGFVLNGVTATAQPDDHHAAFLGEAGFMLAVEVNCHLSLRFGYHALWLEGVAVAGDQIGAINNLNGGPAGAEVDVNGSVKIHGGTAGVMLSW